MKRLILCCDGTWNRADKEDEGVPCATNVLKMAYRVAKRDGTIPQIVFYDQGVGTGNALDRYTGGAFGEGLEDNILDSYRFLVANYEVGDEIFLFGFSRGAFTARSLGGMIRKCGILRREFVRHYREAIELYKSAAEHPDTPRAVKFRKDFSLVPDQDIEVKFIGVWDTVGALGIPMRGLRGLTQKEYQFHDTELSGSVKSAYHALAIDEHRQPFEPTLWAFKPKPGQTVEQTWFCGAHSDVGGGYAQPGLSDITLEWMIERARPHLAFDQAVLTGSQLQPDPKGMLHNSKTGLYRVTPGVDRTIGKAARPTGAETDQADPTQSVHDSVRKRWDGDSSYRPGTLKDYFKRTGDPRGKG